MRLESWAEAHSTGSRRLCFSVTVILQNVDCKLSPSYQMQAKAGLHRAGQTRESSMGDAASVLSSEFRKVPQGNSTGR